MSEYVGQESYSIRGGFMRLSLGRRVAVGFPKDTEVGGSSEVTKYKMSPEEIATKYTSGKVGEKVSPLVAITDPIIEQIHRQMNQQRKRGTRIC